MARIRKRRKDIFHLQLADKTLRLYDPYFRISIIPQKSTFSGLHERKLMFSFGRRYNDKKANEFFSSRDSTRKPILKRMSKEMKLSPEAIIKSQKNGKLKNILVDAVAFQVKKLGIPVIIYKKKASFELYEYVKTTDINEVFQMTLGMLMALGKACQLFGGEPEFLRMKLRIKKITEKFLDRGFYG